MHEQNLAILKGLVCVAWADGRVTATETELLDGLLEAYAAKPSEVLEVRKFAESPRTIADVPIHDLSFDDRRLLLSQAVVLGFVDGELHDRERQWIEELCQVLRVPQNEAVGIVDAALEQASKLLPLLNR